MFYMFLVEHNQSINSADHLVASYYSKLHPDTSKLQLLSCNRTKAAAIIQNVIGKEEEMRIIEKMKAQPFSLLTDKSTDINTTKLLAVVVRTLSEDFRAADKFLCLLQVEDTTAKRLHASITEWMKKILYHIKKTCWLLQQIMRM